MYDVTDGTTPTNNDPLRSGKGNNYEGGVRIPLIVRWPGKTKPGSVNHSVISTVDHYPSLLEMTGQKLRPDDHKDGISYVPVLQGKPFDRGPTLCDFTHFVPATMNIPNTWMRVGDWKLVKFWFDGAGQEHRFELFNLKDDIGETKNLADQYPEKVQSMASLIDGYYEQTGALKPNRNENYNGRTVGVWVGNGRGTVSAADGGVLQMRGEQEQLAAETRITPSLVSGAQLEFDGRSANGNHISIQWTSASQAEYGQPQMAREQLSREWKTYRVNLPFDGRIKKIRFVLRDAGWQADLRNVKLLTPDGSVITEYEFY